MKIPEVKKTTIYSAMIVGGAAIAGAGTILYAKEKRAEAAAEDEIPTIETPADPAVEDAAE